MTTTLQGFVSDDERQSLLEWCDTHPEYLGITLLPNGGPYQLRKISNSNAIAAGDGLPAVAYDIQTRIRERFPMLADTLPRFYHGIVVGVLLPGGEFATHIDEIFRDNEGRVCVGVNALIQSPEGGGVLHIDGVDHPQEAGDAVAFMLSEQMHGVSLVTGNIKRVVWSWRFMVDPTAWNDR
jgi:hypothetical protein